MIGNLIHAFNNSEGLSKHEYCYINRTVKNNNVYQRGGKNFKHEGFVKLTFDQIISDLYTSKSDLSYLKPDDALKLKTAIGYMAERKITKSYSGIIGAVREFFDRLANLFSGNGFSTFVEKARDLQSDLDSLKNNHMNEGGVIENKPKNVAKNYEALRRDAFEYRKKIYEETLHACENGYTNMKGEKITLDHTNMLEGTLTYGHKEVQALAPIEKPCQTDFTVEIDDTFNVLLKLKKEGANPVGINMANRHTAGGGVAEGCPAQEEALCRRSNHILGLKTQHSFNDPKKYLLPEYGGIYCPSVSVFREDEAHDYTFMDQPETVSLVAIAAYDLRGKYDIDYKNLTVDELKKNKKYMTGMRRKIVNMLRTMAAKGHDTLVLGALGCGAFKNPPMLVAEIFKEVFETDEFKGRFKKVVFAVFRQYESDQPNVDAFTDMCKKLMPSN